MNPAACASNSMRYSMKPSRACKHLFLAPFDWISFTCSDDFCQHRLVFHVWVLCARGKLFWGCVLVCFALLRNKANSAIITSLVSFFMHHRNITCISCEASLHFRVCTSSTTKFKSSSTSKSCHLATIVKCLEMPI